MVSLPMSKWMRERCVCAPQYRFAGTSIVPMLSDSLRVFTAGCLDIALSISPPEPVTFRGRTSVSRHTCELHADSKIGVTGNSIRDQAVSDLEVNNRPAYPPHYRNVCGNETIVIEIECGIAMDVRHYREVSRDGAAKAECQSTGHVAFRVVNRLVDGAVGDEGEVLELLLQQQWEDQGLSVFSNAFLDGARTWHGKFQ